MKKSLLLFSALFTCLVFSSCEKMNQPTEKWVHGMWCLTSEEDHKTGELVDTRNQITWYWELSPDGYFNYYQLIGEQPASYNNGILTIPKDSKWEKWMEGKYIIENDALLVSDMVMYHITKISKDKARLDDSTLLEEGIAERIKQLK